MYGCAGVWYLVLRFLSFGVALMLAYLWVLYAGGASEFGFILVFEVGCLLIVGCLLCFCVIV